MRRTKGEGIIRTWRETVMSALQRRLARNLIFYGGRPSTCSSTPARNLSTLPPRKAEALSPHAELAKTSTTGAEAPFGTRCYHILPQVGPSQSRTLQQGTEQYLSLRRSPVRKGVGAGKFERPRSAAFNMLDDHEGYENLDVITIYEDNEHER